MRRSVALAFTVVGVLCGTGCRDLVIPPEPGAPKPGSIQGKVVGSEPGRPGTKPLAGVQVEVLGTGLTTVTDSDGYFRVDGITSDAGQILFRFDSDHDGKPDRQKLLSLKALKAGPDKNVALGDVLLSENATIRGKVLLDEVSTASGHAGTLIFVPVGPYKTTTGDDGSFVLTDLPEGSVSIAFYAGGHSPDGFDNLTLSGGQELTLRTVRLKVATMASPPATVKGRVLVSDGTAAGGASVALQGTGPALNATAGSDGAFTFMDVQTGLYTVTASRTGSASARFVNLLVSGTDVTLPDLVLGAASGGGAGGGGGGEGGGAGGGDGGGSGGGAAGGAGGGSGGGAGGGSGGGAGGGSGGGAGGGSAGGGAAGGGAAGGGAAGGGAAGGGAAGGGAAGGGAGGGSVTIPAAPTSLTVTPGNGQLTIGWNSSAGATRYTLYRSQQPNISKANGTAVTNVTSPYVLQGLTNGTAYYFVVTASNAAGESPDSAAASGIPVLPSAAPLAVVVARPDANERGVAPTSAVVVRFNKTIANATTSTVTLTGPGGPVTGTVTSSANTLTFTPSSALTPESDYTVGLTTGLTDGNAVALAAPVSWKFTTSSPAPVNFRSIVGNRAATLQWDAVPGATSYAVQRSATPTGTPNIFTTRGLSFTDTTPANGTPAYYRVQAQTPFGLTPFSTQLLVTPSPAKPSAPGTPNATGYRSTALVNWPTATNATGYTLYRATQSGGPYTAVTTGSSTTTYLDSGLTPGATYFYVVQTESAAGPSTFSVEVAAVLDASRAQAPAALSASRGYGWLQFTWSAVASASGYVVFRNDSATDAPSLVGFVPQGTGFDALSLSNGNTYRHYVGAVVNGLVGDLSESVSAPGPLFMAQPMTMLQPTPSVNRIDLGWTGGSGATAYVVLRSTTAGGPYSAIGNSTVDTNVTAGTRYYYVVRGDNGSVLGQQSNEVSAVPLAAGTPATPANLVAEASNGALQLRWDPVPGAKQYEVGASTSPGGPYTSSTCYASETYETRCTLGATNETTLYLAVRSYNGTTYSPYGAEVSATPTAVGPTAGLPSPSMTTVGGNTAITIGWSSVPNATSYRLFRRSHTSDWVEITSPLQATSYTDTGLTNGVAYRYAVQAVNASGPRVSVWRTTGDVTPSAKRPPRPVGFTVTPYNGGFQVSWSPLAGATAYSVQAGFSAGSSVYSPAVSCSSYGAYESRCTFSASNGTTYFVSMNLTSPQGDGAFTDEVQVVPEPLSPATPSPTYAAGNGSISLTAAPVSGATSYRFYQRGFDTDWQLKGTSPAIFYRSDAINGGLYRLAVEAIDGAGHSSAWSLSGWLTPSQLRPQGVTGLALSGANGQFLAQWDPIVGVTDYIVMCGAAPGAPMSQRGSTSDPFDTRVSFTGTNGASLSCSLWSYGNSLYGDFVNQVTASATSAVPLTPTLTLTPGNEAMGLSWTSVSGATGYRVYRRSPVSDWAQLVTTAGLSWIDERVQNGETFRYAVQAVGSGGDSAWSFSPLSLVDPNLPHAPLDLTVRPGNAAVQVDWAPVAGATSYALYTASAQGGPYAYVTSTSGQYENRARLAATNGTPLWVAVNAYNGTGTSVLSSPDSATPSASLPTATYISAVAQPAAGTIRLSWGTVSGATGYKIYRRVAQGAPSLIATSTMVTTDDVGLVSGTAYTYYVEVQNAAGSSAWSPPSTATAN